jgi:hypothetical protein
LFPLLYRDTLPPAHKPEQQGMENQPNQPPTLPPVPVQPLTYATPIYEQSQTNTRFHQAAKASWVAPIVAFALSCLSRGMASEPGEKIGFLVLSLAMVAMIVAGLICGIVALCGMKRVGTRGIIAPAIVGVVLNLLILTVPLSLVLKASSSRLAARRASAAAARVPAPITSPQSALRQTGWVGSLVTPKYHLTIIAFAEGHADTLDFMSHFTTPCLPLVLSADNRAGSNSFTVNADGATLRFADGKVVTSLRTRDVFNTDPNESLKLQGKFGSPFTVKAGELVDTRFLFIPTGLDLSKLTSITLTVDDKPQTFYGEIVTAAEKTQRMNKPDTK